MESNRMAPSVGATSYRPPRASASAGRLVARSPPLLRPQLGGQHAHVHVNRRHRNQKDRHHGPTTLTPCPPADGCRI